MSKAEDEALECRLVLEAIHAKYGYDFREYAEPTIRRRLQAALAKSGLPHLGALQHELLVDGAFFRWLLDGLTVHVSEMFRDPPFFDAFRQQVVPLLRTYPVVKIWHAGCAGGEEVYTIAILLIEEGLYERTQLYATDISPGAIERAKEGIYDEAEVTAFTQNYRSAGGKFELSEYYTAAYGKIALREAVRKNIVFFEHDLTSDHALGEMHVILCRNVLLYFGNRLRSRVLDMFTGALARRGFLCLGLNESLPETHALRFEELVPSRIFRRVEGA